MQYRSLSSLFVREQKEIAARRQRLEQRQKSAQDRRDKIARHTRLVRSFLAEGLHPGR